jgi:uncharacterized protein YndB with AHSA1/START domain
MELHSDRRYHFDAEPAKVWGAMGSVERYQEWWPWLRSFEATGLVAGDRWICTVKPPLPYTVHFTVHLEEVVPVARIVAGVSGDIGGRARLDFSAAEDGCIVHLHSDLAPANTLLRVLTRVGRPIARHGHDWVLDVGAGQFASRAL